MARIRQGPGTNSISEEPEVTHMYTHKWKLKVKLFLKQKMLNRVRLQNERKSLPAICMTCDLHLE